MLVLPDAFKISSRTARRSGVKISATFVRLSIYPPSPPIARQVSGSYFNPLAGPLSRFGVPGSPLTALPERSKLVRMFRTELEQRALLVTRVDAPSQQHDHRLCAWDILTWRRNHDSCDSCGTLFIYMSPMANVLRHWTGACVWGKESAELTPAEVTSASVVSLLEDVTWIVPAASVESNKLRMAIRLVRDFPSLINRQKQAGSQS
jgi:hypothetical protein